MAKRQTKRRHATSSNGAAQTALVALERIETCIHVIRGQRVMLDADLAEFYDVPVRALNQAVKRNATRFPDDFAFQLTQTEAESLRSQIVTLNVAERDTVDTSHGPWRRGKHRKYPPHAFTEHGAIMAASVLNSPRAVQMSVLVVRAFVRLRQILATHQDLARRLEALEREFVRRTDDHEEHIRRIYKVLDDLMSLPEPMEPPEPPPKGRIGFTNGAADRLRARAGTKITDRLRTRSAQRTLHGASR